MTANTDAPLVAPDWLRPGLPVDDRVYGRFVVEELHHGDRQLVVCRREIGAGLRLVLSLRDALTRLTPHPDAEKGL